MTVLAMQVLTVQPEEQADLVVADSLWRIFSASSAIFSAVTLVVDLAGLEVLAAVDAARECRGAQISESV